MNSIFYMHLIATLVNAFFIILLWRYNHSLIKTNKILMQTNRELMVEAKKLQQRINDLEAIMPGTI